MSWILLWFVAVIAISFAAGLAAAKLPVRRQRRSRLSNDAATIARARAARKCERDTEPT